jgi:hypothetical protein
MTVVFEFTEVIHARDLRINHFRLLCFVRKKARLREDPADYTHLVMDTPFATFLPVQQRFTSRSKDSRSSSEDILMLKFSNIYFGE